MNRKSEADDRRVLRYLRDKTTPKLTRLLAGLDLDEGDCLEALISTEDLLANARAVVRLRLNAISNIGR